MDKRYQVFVSSTYNDLREERSKVIHTLLSMDCIPAGMELFPAADEEQFQFIKRVIKDCDYYLVIIGGRYGSLMPSGVSYTEREYDYAVEIGLKIVALVHDDPESFVQKSDANPELQERLRAFRAKVSTGRIVQFWNRPDDLPGKVAVSMQNTMKLYPAVGWVRANRVATTELLEEVNALRKRNEELEREAAKNAPANISNLADLTDRFEVAGETSLGNSRSAATWTATLSWAELFSGVAPYIFTPLNQDQVAHYLGATAVAKTTSFASHASDMYKNKLASSSLETIKVQFMALGFIAIQYLQTVSGGMGIFWQLTPSGTNAMLRLRSVKSLFRKEGG